MTPADPTLLARVREVAALMKAATPGPWAVERHHDDPESGNAEIQGPGSMGSRLVIAQMCGSLAHRGVDADAHFLVSLVNLAPALIDAVEARVETNVEDQYFAQGREVGFVAGLEDAVRICSELVRSKHAPTTASWHKTAEQCVADLRKRIAALGADGKGA